MDNQINTGGGAAIQGDANIGGDLVRDKTINNIVVLSNLLHYAQIEEILPKIQHAESFSNLTAAIEGALEARLSSDLAKATAFAGEILGDFISTQLPSDPGEPVSLKIFISKLINHIGISFKKTGYWDAYSQSRDQSPYGRQDITDVLWLEATIMLWNKKCPDDTYKAIFIGRSDDAGLGVPRYTLFIGGLERTASFNPRKLRILISGIVLDLIRIGSDATVTTEFLKSVVEQFSPHRK